MKNFSITIVSLVLIAALTASVTHYFDYQTTIARQDTELRLYELKTEKIRLMVETEED